MRKPELVREPETQASGIATTNTEPPNEGLQLAKTRLTPADGLPHAGPRRL